MKTTRRDTQSRNTRTAAERLSRVIRRWPSADARDWVEHFVTAACNDEHVDAVLAIGSAIRPMGHGRSDVDLVVIYHSRPPRTADRHVSVDVRMFTRESVDQRIREGNDLLDWT